MKIATITCYDVDNYGATLQAYALCQYINNEGIECQVIDYHPTYHRKSICSISNRKYNKIWLRPLYLLYKIPIRFYKRTQLKKRRYRFELFRRNHIPSTKRYYGYENLLINPPEADIYIAGSDQIWNTTFPNGTDPAFYLDFGNPKKRLSYAASFAVKFIEQHKQAFLKNHLRKFDSISVREKSALKILEDLGYNGINVVDPVFLLDSSQWDQVASNLIDEAKEYVLVYDFFYQKNICDIAKFLAKISGKKIYSISPHKLKYADKHFYNYGPDVFISLIRNAYIVISNSFHGTAFSLIYKKDFIFVNRPDSLNERMQNLLDNYGLQSRLVNSVQEVRDLALRPIDWDRVCFKISQDIKLSKTWLSSEINKSHN